MSAEEIGSGDAPRRRFYGRRQGRALRLGQRALFDERLPQLSLTRPAAGEGIDLAAAFGAPKRAYRLEIGFGGGEHLAAQAQRLPETGFVGCEPFVNGVVSALGHIQRQGIENVRLFPDDARLILPHLPDATFEAAYILFPDPWPKSRHNKRRIVRQDVLDQLARLLIPGAELRMATDIPDYAAWMLDETRRHPAFEWTARRPGDWLVPPDDHLRTRYESKAVAAGRASAYLRFVRR